MAGRLALLCPGQGAQHRGMFDLARTDTRVANLIDSWLPESLLGMPLDAILTDDKLLFANRYAQPLIVAATLAMWEAVKPLIPVPSLIAGYSVGELSTYGVAGSLAPAEAICLAARRARLMDDCVGSSPKQALVAISGMRLRHAPALLASHGFHIAIETAEDSFIAGGPFATLDDVVRAAAQRGARCQVLPVEVASHTPFMLGASALFADELERSGLVDPAVPVLSGIGAEMVRFREQAIGVLARQISEPIRWMDCMDACGEAGVTVALELGPGAGLMGMLRGRTGEIACRSVGEFRSLDGIREWVANEWSAAL